MPILLKLTACTV